MKYRVYRVWSWWPRLWVRIVNAGVWAWTKDAGRLYSFEMYEAGQRRKIYNSEMERAFTAMKEKPVILAVVGTNREGRVFVHAVVDEEQAGVVACLRDAIQLIKAQDREVR